MHHNGIQIHEVVEERVMPTEFPVYIKGRTKPMMVIASSKAEAEKIMEGEGHIVVKVKYCGNRNCSTSTGICGAQTHGYGEWDDNGYNSHPCFICARHYEKIANGGNASNALHWPFPVVSPPSIDEQRRQEYQDIEQLILLVLAEEGTLWIDELHKICTSVNPSMLFDEVICELVFRGKLQFIFPGPSVALAFRTSMPTFPRRIK